MPKHSSARLILRGTGEEIEEGALIKTFRDEPVRFLHITRLPGGGSGGKVLLQRQDGAPHEYYPSVVRCYIEAESE